MRQKRCTVAKTKREDEKLPMKDEKNRKKNGKSRTRRT